MSKKHKQASGVRTLQVVLFSVVVLFAFLNLLGIMAEATNPKSWIAEYSYWFDLDKEGNLPTFYTSSLLFACGVVSSLIAFRSTSLKRAFWAFLGILFTFLAADELLVIHERVSEPIRNTLSINEGLFFHAWVIPAFVVSAVLAIAFIYMTFVGIRSKAINKDVIGLFLLLLVGVSTIETLGTLFYENTNIYRTLIVPLEELFEISMISLILVKVTQEFEKTFSKHKRDKIKTT